MNQSRIIKIILIASTIGLYWHARTPKYSPNITELHSYKEVEKELETVDENSLVIFDVDDTLITIRDSLVNAYMFSLWFKIRLFLKHPSLIISSNLMHYYSLMFQKVEFNLVESRVPSFIKALKKKTTVLALTFMNTGKFGVIENMEEWRFKQLKDLGIEFSPKFEDFIFKEDFLPYHNNYPVLFKGILCANIQSKGLVLKAFLKKYNLKPNKIIFFDDDKKHLLSVEKVCKDLKIPYHGYNYFGAKHNWDTKTALFQLDYLMKNNLWLTESEAIILQGSPSL